MSVTTAPPAGRSATAALSLDALKSDPAYQGYMLLRIGFTVAGRPGSRVPVPPARANRAPTARRAV